MIRACLGAVAGALGLLSPLAAPAAPPEDAWIMPKAAGSLLVDIADAGGRWVAVGERGHVLISDDARRWTQVEAPTRVLLTAVSLDDTGLGLAVGHDSTIILSRDFGETWERVHHDPGEPAPFLDVIIVSERRAVAVGAYGRYAESRDGGQSWDTRMLEPEAAASDDSGDGEEFYYDYHLNDIAIADEERWYIAAEAGNLYRSDDGGETWLRLPSPYEGSFLGILPLDRQRVLAFGLQGRLFRSGDAGASWSRIDTGTDAILAAGRLLPDGRVLIGGYAGAVLGPFDPRSAVAATVLGNRPAVSDLRLLDNGALLTVGDAGVRRWPASVLSGN
ncbi:MAG TPA: YCF48-related protein [Arenicellales bacterium]|nr:YCF48-related protein [Arenicellales bacterium]